MTRSKFEDSAPETTWPPREATSNQRNKSQSFNFPCKYIVAKKPLGEGSFSSVFECKNTETSRHYAAKRYNKKLVFGLEEMLQNEFQILKSKTMSHKNLLTLIDYFETEKYIYLVTDLAQGGELFYAITEHPQKKLPEKMAKDITIQLVDAVEYLHSQNIIHRDIKPENILFQNHHTSDILLADFGLARVLENKSIQGMAGTLSYLAPEIVLKQEYSFPIDMWALGVTVYFMLCGYMPFDCETDDETKEAICSGDYMFEPQEYWQDVSEEAKEFLRNCFVVDPKQRMTLKEAKSHPFVSKAAISRAAVSMSSIRSSSSMNLLASLKQQLQTSGIGSSPAAYRSYLDMSRLSSMTDASLSGALCQSPATISAFTTPLSSADVSRVASMDMFNTASIKREYAGSGTASFFI